MLIDYLRSLLGLFVAKNETAFIVNQVTPAKKTISVSTPTTVSEWTEFALFTAQADGYLEVQATSTDIKAVVSIASDPMYSSVVFPWNGSNSKGFLPIKKGMAIALAGTKLKDVSVKVVYLTGNA